MTDRADRLGQLGNEERKSLLRTFDEVVPKIVARNPKAVDRELAGLRRLRRTGGRLAG